jgi:uncharacterized membrane protein YdjX (TVP38/TMEM64 family)
MALIQMLQTITAFLPDAPIQALAGLAYGKWGMLIALAGIVLGNAIVFLAVRYGGDRLLNLLPDAHKKPKHRLLSIDTLDSMKHPEIIVAAMHIIPGSPDGLLPYVFGRTGMGLLKFLLFVVIGELPALLLTVGFGSSLGKGDKSMSIVFIVGFVLLIAFGYLFRDRIFARIEKNQVKEA